MAEPASRGVPACPPTGYTLVLPDQWSKIPLRFGTDGAIKAIVDRASAGRSRDELAEARRDLTVRLREQAAAAAKTGGLDLYLPTEEMHGFRLPASFVVAEVSFGSLDPLDPVALTARLVADSDSASAITLDGVLGSRTENLEPPAKNGPISRHVSYAAAVPQDPDRWMLINFSTTGNGAPGDEFADLMVELFDAMISTFRWTYPSEGTA